MMSATDAIYLQYAIKNSGNIVQDLYNDLVIDYTNRLISVV